MDKLTDKQKMFCDEYLVHFNATRAYKAAGYSVSSDEVAWVNASKLLRNHKVEAYLNEAKHKRSERLEINADRVVQEIAAIAFSNITDVLEIDMETNPMSPIVVKDLEELPKYVQKSIASIGIGMYGLTVKMHGKNVALDKLMKHLGLYEKDNSQKTPSVLDDLDLNDKLKVIMLINDLKNGNK